MRMTKIFLTLIAFWASLTFAQTLPLVPFYEITSLEVNIKIDQKGEVEVEKKFLLSGPTLEFSWTEELPISQLQIFASGSKLNKRDYKLKKEKGRLFIKARKIEGSQVWILRYKSPSALKSNTNDQFHLPLVSEPGVYVRELSAKLSLPSPIDLKELKQKVYAIHGVGKTECSPLNSQTLVFKGSELSPFSIYTIEASWPKGTLKYPFLKQIFFKVQSAGFKFWITVGLILPLLVLLFSLFMLYLKWLGEKMLPRTYLDKPPFDLPPALVGILLREKASQREITATVLDLASRGFIDVVRKREEYVLGKRQGKGTLRPFEAFLYDKLFTEQGERKIKRTELELEKRAAEQLYSPKISQFYQYLYQEIQKRNYFVKNPSSVALKYRIFGILFFLSAILTSILAVKFSPGPPFALFGAFGQMGASLLIIKVASLMPRRTKVGKMVLSLWLSFGQFLSDRSPLGLSEAQQGFFEKYLPCAVALGKEIDWARRFANVAYTPPSWYTAEGVITLENFVGSLFYITGSLSQILYGLREPSL